MEKLLSIMQTLREKCPWDQAQTPMSLTRYAIEEAYEVEDAVRSGDWQHVKEELGDLLLQVVFQAQMFMLLWVKLLKTVIKLKILKIKRTSNLINLTALLLKKMVI